MTNGLFWGCFGHFNMIHHLNKVLLPQRSHHLTSMLDKSGLASTSQVTNNSLHLTCIRFEKQLNTRHSAMSSFGHEQQPVGLEPEWNNSLCLYSVCIDCYSKHRQLVKSCNKYYTYCSVLHVFYNLEYVKDA